ncbi:AbrB/MazE/SpoVT family DNA-binding domain-containing protein [Zongyangia hominis]|uniref:AbrB/MazE/SpoVT family DNA-binding domain-containing protein n=1 Tax=Zongyangia hominis TaxID=2763677 RepID=A0A926IAW1_9FIRM|nr:AbrB/MazE/SpoVT family DNA-binding domain-containing protein [Zongyangia hominis]MBC8570616.1 AbrB/MazE/SpoVT family DNA-binding domain-containing protein [Zongyangia hominis]
MKLKFNRKVDELGRIVLPMDVRRHLGFGKDQVLEITVQDDVILLRKAPESVCTLCGKSEGVFLRGRYRLCEDCFQEITQAAKV